MNNKTAVISLSGGMDSTCLLIWLLANGYSVYALSFDYGQKHRIELQRLLQNLDYLHSEKHFVEHKIIDISILGELFSSSLTNDNKEVPQGHYENENMKSTVVPNRNAIFMSIIYGYALSIAKEQDTNVDIFLGVHSGDHEIYPDCRPEFYKDIMQAFRTGNWDAEKVDLNLPYLMKNKTLILQDCLENCFDLKLDFDTILKNTNTSYNPDEHGRSSGTSGADIERIEAFVNINRKDPVEYVLPWKEIKANAIKTLNNE